MSTTGQNTPSISGRYLIAVTSTVPVPFPVVWRIDWLEKRLTSSLPFVPSSRLLTFALYQQLDSSQRLNVLLPDLLPMGINKVEYYINLQDRYLLQYTLPILLCSTNAGNYVSRAATDKKKALTSVLISTYNAGNRLSWAIQSVLSQTLHNLELIIIDDGSTDGTQKLLQKFPDERLYVIRLTVNRGKAHALNQGLRIASGYYICELDADDWLAPEALEIFTREMESRNDTVSLLSGGYHLWVENSREHIIYKKKVEPQRFVWNEQSATPPIPRFYRTRALRETGGWPEDDPSDGRLFEDVAVCTKLIAKHKDSFQVVNQALYHRVLRRTSVSQQHRALYPEWATKWGAQLTEESVRNPHSEGKP